MPNRPASLLDLFLSFQWMALQGFGGVLTVVQRVLCEQKRWLTEQQFAEDWAVSQVLPGPNVVNLALILGDRYFGIRGALAALAGLFLAPLIIVATLAVLHGQFANVAFIAGAVKGMGAVAAGMIGAVGLKLLPTIKTSPIGKPMFLAMTSASFVLVALFRLPLIAAILCVGLPSICWTYRQLKLAQASQRESQA
ncbi:MAG: chromate transporter [Cytophagales bacterium]|nr:chromate transporter [Cytophagales bacterium]